MSESYGELADRMVREAERCPHPDFEDGACPECGSGDPDVACISHPDWEAEPIDRMDMPPLEALRECYDLWASGAWRDDNAVYDLGEVMGYVNRLLKEAQS